ncbi:hypothetical protein [Cohnella sp.]|uniref:hypothetical protein n=1 Tax=Cohnella sp. TaxID=1883426 RepID=UPI003568FACE
MRRVAADRRNGRGGPRVFAVSCRIGIDLGTHTPEMELSPSLSVVSYLFLMAS